MCVGGCVSGGDGGNGKKLWHVFTYFELWPASQCCCLVVGPLTSLTSPQEITRSFLLTDHFLQLCSGNNSSCSKNRGEFTENLFGKLIKGCARCYSFYIKLLLTWINLLKVQNEASSFTLFGATLKLFKEEAPVILHLCYFFFSMQYDYMLYQLHVRYRKYSISQHFLYINKEN